MANNILSPPHYEIILWKYIFFLNHNKYIKYPVGPIRLNAYMPGKCYDPSVRVCMCVQNYIYINLFSVCIWHYCSRSDFLLFFLSLMPDTCQVPLNLKTSWEGLLVPENLSLWILSPPIKTFGVMMNPDFFPLLWSQKSLKYIKKYCTGMYASVYPYQYMHNICLISYIHVYMYMNT